MCSEAHQSLFQLPPSIWWAAVAVPHVKPSGKGRGMGRGRYVRRWRRGWPDGLGPRRRSSTRRPSTASSQLLDLEQIEVNLFRGVSPRVTRQRVFGGQVAGQALVAAARTVDPEHGVVHSLHAYFLRPGDPSVPILYEVDRIRDGRSFTTRRVVAIQHGKAIFNLSASVPAARAGPGAPGADARRCRDPESLPTFKERWAPHAEELGDWYTRPRPIDFRTVNWNPERPQARPLPPIQRVWFRASGQLPDDPVLHTCVLTYASDMTLLDTTTLPHGGEYDEQAHA